MGRRRKALSWGPAPRPQKKWGVVSRTETASPPFMSIHPSRAAVHSGCPRWPSKPPGDPPSQAEHQGEGGSTPICSLGPRPHPGVLCASPPSSGCLWGGCGVQTPPRGAASHKGTKPARCPPPPPPVSRCFLQKKKKGCMHGRGMHALHPLHPRSPSRAPPACTGTCRRLPPSARPGLGPGKRAEPGRAGGLSLRRAPRADVTSRAGGGACRRGGRGLSGRTAPAQPRPRPRSSRGGAFRSRGPAGAFKRERTQPAEAQRELGEPGRLRVPGAKLQGAGPGQLSARDG